MTNLDLEILELQGARWVPIQPGTKRPQGRDWQRHGRRLAEITTPAVGMLLGEPSSGIMAVDFDGESALDYWHTHILDHVPDTVMWTSGRPGRAQAAFRVPAEIRPWVPTRFVVNTGPSEQLEWRWGTDQRGFQSVMPPSPHPDTGGYVWLPGLGPQDVTVAEMPAEVLAWALAQVPAQSGTPEAIQPWQPRAGSQWQESQALRRIGEIMAGMRPGDRSHRACQIGALMRSVRGELHAEIFAQLSQRGCDRAALASARHYSRQM